jgi:hypothetical protein
MLLFPPTSSSVIFSTLLSLLRFSWFISLLPSVNFYCGTCFAILPFDTCGTQQHSWLRHYGKSWKVVGSIPDEVMEFSIYLILSSALWPWDWLSLQQKWVWGIFLEVKGQLACKADSLATICEPIV